MSRRDSRGVSGSTSASPPLLQLQRQMGSLPAWEGPLGTTTSCEQQEPTACTQRRGTYLQVTVTPAKQAAPACQARHQTEEEPRLWQSSCARQVFPAGALQPACMKRKKNHEYICGYRVNFLPLPSCYFLQLSTDTPQRAGSKKHRHPPWSFAGIRLHPPWGTAAGAGDGKPGDNQCPPHPLLQPQGWQPTAWAPRGTALPSSRRAGCQSPIHRFAGIFRAESEWVIPPAERR